MRLKLTLTSPPNSTLAYEHHHALRAVIYKILQLADPLFSEWLHEKGYTLEGNKKFKLFTFGLLTGKPYRHDKPNNRLIFPTGIVEWTVSFNVDTQVEKFVEGLFKSQVLEVVAAGTKVVFKVQGVEINQTPIFTDTMRFRAQSGICISEQTNNDRYAQYRTPNDINFKELFFKNLHHKVQTALKTKMDTPQYMALKILSEPRMWSAIVPSDQPNGKDNKTIGYRFDFDITAPAECCVLLIMRDLAKNVVADLDFVRFYKIETNTVLMPFSSSF